MPGRHDRPSPSDEQEGRGSASPRQVSVFAPSPLYTVTVEQVTDHAPEIHFHAGGQGFWIARMIDRLGVSAVLCGPLGGETGAVLRTLIEREGVILEAVATQGWNGGYIHDRRGGSDRRNLADVPAPDLTRHEVDDLYGAMLVAGLAAGVAVLTGPSHAGVIPAHVYERLPQDLGRNGVAVVADLSGDVLKAVRGGVTYLKVSHSELIEAGCCRGDSREDLVEGARAIREHTKARHVVVSRAHEPTLALLEDRLVEVIGPSFEPLDHRGAGNSMTAGLAVACARGLDATAALKLATAAGALNVTRHGLGSGRRESIEAILERVEVRPVSA